MSASGGLPAVTLTLRFDVELRLKVTAPPVAVKGPMVDGVAGSARLRPLAGTGLGIGALNEIVPLEMLEGVAPVASTVADAVPDTAVLPRADVAETISDGMATVVWKPLKLNLVPVESVAGEMVPATWAPFSTMVPTGVFGQYSSNSEEVAKAKGAEPRTEDAATAMVPPAMPRSTAAAVRRMPKPTLLIVPLPVQSAWRVWRQARRPASRSIGHVTCGSFLQHRQD